ncbi:MAG: phage holin family protein [Lachnospiraceae bacterium]|nr:phage holin family protein [Lachnospiraceae bacterium]
MTFTRAFLEQCANNKMILLVIIGVIIDTIFGVLRAIKWKKFNSSVGIDGAIRKAGMLVSLIFFQAIDILVHINLIGFIPEEVRSYIGGSIGLTEFFAILYIAYEVTSILKNMALCGLPVKHVWEAVSKFLSKYTDELPDADELDEKKS